MVVVRISFGLANQMFQYAAGRALALRNKQLFKLDLSFFDARTIEDGPSHEKYGLKIFKGIDSVGWVSNKEISSIRNKYENKLIYRFLNKAKRAIGLQPFYTYCWEKKLLRFDSDILTKKGDIIYLNAYFQNEFYFNDFQRIIKHDFEFKESFIDQLNLELGLKMQREESVSLHIRRGDYLGKRFVAPVDYYKRAIDYFLQKLNSPSFYIFSDDPEWAKDNIIFDGNCNYVTHNKFDNSYKDMYLMSKCKHNIIANSSFSWWGAWLNDNEDKIVISPTNWFPEKNIYSSDVIPTNWLTL
ncbi:MAG: alpha-1,2-fucosyltransferase [Janthinobacterium lividum]